jgi:hypothetical protein
MRTFYVYSSSDTYLGKLDAVDQGVAEQMAAHRWPTICIKVQDFRLPCYQLAA